MHYALEIDAWTGSGVQTLRFCSGPHSVVTEGGLVYRAAILDPGLFARDLGDIGAVNTNAGGITLVNTGRLDALYGYGFSGRPFTLREYGEGQDPSTAPAVARGVLAGLGDGAALTEIALRLRDPLAALQVPLLTARYAGTTTDGTLLTAEGDADLKDELKPLTLGNVANATPKLVNPFRLVYQVSVAAVASIAVFDGGVPLTSGGDHPTLSALLGATIAPGSFATCLALGLFRLGGTAVYGITADVLEAGAAGERSAARVAARMLARLGLTYDTDSFDALDADAPAEVGLFVSDESEALDLVQRVLGSVGAWLVPTSQGVLRAVRLEAPAGEPVTTLGLRELGPNTSFTPSAAAASEGRGVPAWSVVLQYGRSWTVQDAGGLAGNVGTSRKAFVTEEWRKATAQDASVKTAHPLAPELTFETLLVDAADAATEAARRLALWKVRRDVIVADLAAGLARRELGDIVAITMPRLGYDAGRLFVVRGREDNFKTRRATLTLWG